jgi:5-methylthioadenosine/S-adenosylhomocysteine deaminase
MSATLFTDVLVYDGAVTAATDVLVLGRHIAVIGPGARADAPAGARIIEGGHHLLVPGLINAHFHSPANHLKGALPSLPLELFMLYESPAEEVLRPTPREAYLRTMLAALEMLRSGATCVQDDAFLMPSPSQEIIDAVMCAYADCGIRASVALDQPTLPESQKLPFLDRVSDPDFAAMADAPAPATEEELLASYRYFIERWHGAADGRLTAAVSISAPQRVSVEYFRALDALSAEYHIPLFAHLLETKTQRTLATEQPRFGGRSLVDYTASLGLLSERMNVIHAVWVDEADLDLIAACGASVAHNPVSNLRLGSGVMPFRAMRDRGIPIALGVDEAICNDACDMWGVVRMAGLIHNISGLDSTAWPQATEVLDCLWRGGAQALLRGHDLGRVAVGYLADLALLDLHSPAFTPLNDIAGQLVYCENGASVVATMVDGVLVAENGQVTSVDEQSLLAEARALFAARQPALRTARAQADRWLPSYQEIVRAAAATDVGMTRWAGTV